MTDIKNNIDELEKKITNLEKKIDLILEILQKNTDNCEKMGHHIDFVENVYENVKNPLGYICNKVSYIMGGSEDYKSLDN